MFNYPYNELDLRNICRICLISSRESIDLFCESEESLEILKKIMLCFQIILNSEKYLPCVICKNCIDELDIANNFRIKCVTINERFKQHCKNLLKSTSQYDSEAERRKEFAEDSQPAHEGDDNDSESTTIPTNSGFKCDICNKVLKTLKSLENHIVGMHEKRRHVGRVTGYGTSRRYHCTTCSYATPHSQTLVNHMRRHNGDRPFSCECGKSFTQASSLAAHRKTHSTTSYFTCTECGKQFKHAFTLKTHLRVHVIGRFNCSICLKVLKSKEALQSHMKRHYKVYNYSCEECGNTFVTSAELNNHRLKHSSVKDIVCHICHYATNTRKCLLVHLKR